MLIGVISDTHDNVEATQKAIKLFNQKRVGLVVHCGDLVSPFLTKFFTELNCRVIAVFGNNEGDKFRLLKLQNKIEYQGVCAELNLDGKRVVVYHGDSKILLNALLKSQIYDVVFSGHDHNARITKEGKTLYVNPGTLSGFPPGTKPTVAIYNTETNQAEIQALE
ncbi:hypothetical protein DRJ48_04135 [Candidatus Woesearchaeota archaeon]|nr:MAG: hypothetical protein DRJ48_04135 [Candidatus Woesearchaeota archaeon]